jgi:hypothetical protein
MRKIQMVANDGEEEEEEEKNDDDVYWESEPTEFETNMRSAMHVYEYRGVSPTQKGIQVLSHTFKKGIYLPIIFTR